MKQCVGLPPYFLRELLLQFTVLDEDTLCELVSFFQNLFIVDVGHGGDEALKKKQDVSHTQRSKLFHHAVPPGLSRQR